MQVSEVMHKGIITAQISDSLRKVASLMKDRDIGSIPIYKNERAVGFVTDRDIVISCVANGKNPDEPVSLAMRHELFSIHEHQDISEASRVMKEKQVSRLLVLSKGDKPVGMLTIQDLNKVNSNYLQGSTVEGIKRN